MNPELSGSNRRLSLCVFLLLVLLLIGRGKDLAQARTITAQYIFLIRAIVAEPWPRGRQWQGGAFPCSTQQVWVGFKCYAEAQYCARQASLTAHKTLSWFQMLGKLKASLLH